MDRGWIQNPDKNSAEYKLGIAEFVEAAKKHVNHRGLARCPCTKCNNCGWMTLRQITVHLITNGMSYSYTVWTHNGERMETRLRSSSANLFDNSSVSKDTNSHNDEVMDIINDLYPYATHPGCDKNGAEQSNAFHDAAAEDQYLPDIFSEEIEKYERLLKEAQDELYPGCKEFSVLTSIVELMQLKVKNLMTNKCFDELMGILKRMLPLGNKLPTSHRHAQKVLKNIGLGYIKIHACPYDCVLFYKENEQLDECPVCKEPRYELNSNGKKNPKKVLRYFPLKPRLQRLYMSHHTADHMTWHKDGRVEDGIMRHPADTIAWKELDKAYADFAKEPRNVRLGLASDGFNPFGDIRTPYSMWPVMVVPYNLPPWMCMKKEYTMLTLLILGKREPGKEIDVYLRPLIEELKELWETGLPTYDKVSNSIFNLHAAVLWTISDLPGYGNLSGWSTKGYNACPNCNDDGTSMWFGGKVCFMGHRRWLPTNHVWRKNKKSFDGKPEFRAKPKKLSGEEILSQVESLEFGQIGKHPCNPNKKRKRTPEQRNWTKKSIFFELEYWSKLIIRHNLDVMHIEKNVCDITLGTILDIERKTKDTFKARKDLQALGIRESLWLQRNGDKWVKKHPFFAMKPNSKIEFLQFLKSVRYPDGYAANISKNVALDTGKITGLKSHDNHVLLQRVLPVGIRKYLPKEVVDPIVRLSSFFQQLCSKTICTADIQKLQDEIVYILCKFEQIFPPSFFVSMIHLMVHLPEEARQGGTVTERWMYPIERMLGRYKKFVRNKARPEGSIAEAYVSQESLNFCAMYLHKVETPFNKSERNFDGGPRHEKLSVFAQPSRPIMSCSSIPFSSSDMEVAHWFILTNCDEVIPFLEEHKAMVMLGNGVNIDNIHRKLFPSWFRERVRRLGDENSSLYNEELFELARGPLRAETYQGCIVNGVKFVVWNKGEMHSESERYGLHRTEENTFISSSDEVEIEDDAGELPRTEVDNHGRGPCKQIKTSRLVRLSKHRIEVPYNKVTRRATSAEIHSLLVHDVGAIIRSHCPMNTGFWGKISLENRTDLMDEITTNFKINFEDPDVKEYINRLYNGRYREFKAELSKYYKSCKTHANALASPPEEMVDRDVNEWEWLCNHFNSDKFKNSSSANTSNRSNKKDNHHTGSRPLSYIVEDMLADGSKFPEVAAFELTYAGKDKCWTNDATKEQHEQMVAKANEYLIEKAKEYNLPEDNPLNEIPVDDPDIGLEIMMSVLGPTPGRRIHGLGDGRLRETRPTSEKVKHLESELEVERAARKAADAARREAEERMQITLKNVGNKFKLLCDRYVLELKL